TPISLDLQWIGSEQKKMAQAFSAAYASIRMMCDTNNANKELKDTPKPALGDVIWLRTGGGKMVGFALAKERHGDPINTKALKTILQCANRKAKEMKMPFVGFETFGCETGTEWASIVGIIEDELTDCMAVCCVPTNERLLDVIDNLPGSKKIHAFNAETKIKE
ncbi:MAG: hypothetical protein ACR2PH_02005, partial [Desulfobulbia bacterium]